jgi:hypothetical protein
MSDAMRSGLGETLAGAAVVETEGVQPATASASTTLRYVFMLRILNAGAPLL